MSKISLIKKLSYCRYSEGEYNCIYFFRNNTQKSIKYFKLTLGIYNTVGDRIGTEEFTFPRPCEPNQIQSMGKGINSFKYEYFGHVNLDQVDLVYYDDTIDTDCSFDIDEETSSTSPAVSVVKGILIAIFIICVLGFIFLSSKL